MAKTKTKAERRHLDQVAAIGCILCRELGNGYQPAQVHHIREGQGLSQRAGHYLTIPLCPECHTGENGVHCDKTLLRIAKVNELDLLGLVISIVGGYHDA